ncbi:MAG TPA: tetratricopeptide repeat protein [Gemmatimonadaceae bacterium]|nr:tetratricopeptide repeat protein [Gemmatimonadaceae bacterium]
MHVRYLALAAGLALTFGVASAQSPAEHIKLADQAYDALKPADAITHYEAAIAADPKDYDALWKASRTLVDLAEFEQDAAKRQNWYKSAELYARRAIEAKPDDAEGHFSLARALGRVALTLGAKERVKYAGDVRNEALEALKYNPNHAGALHVMGVWNAEVMRLSGFSRFMAKNFLGGKVFNSASWPEAQRYMEKAVEVDPERLTHHLDLGRVYADRGMKDKAREQFELVVNGKAREYNDPQYQRQAAEALKKL